MFADGSSRFEHREGARAWEIRADRLATWGAVRRAWVGAPPAPVPVDEVEEVSLWHLARILVAAPPDRGPPRRGDPPVVSFHPARYGDRVGERIAIVEWSDAGFVVDGTPVAELQTDQFRGRSEVWLVPPDSMDWESVLRGLWAVQVRTFHGTQVILDARGLLERPPPAPPTPVVPQTRDEVLVVHRSEVDFKRVISPAPPQRSRPAEPIVGDCEVRAHFDRDGRVTDVEWVECPEAFRASVDVAVRSTTCYPFRRGGVVHPIVTTLTYHFAE